AIQIEQRTPAVPRVDGGVGLQQVFVGLVVVDIDIPRERADDSRRDGMLVAESVPHGDDRLAQPQVGGCSQGDHGERATGLDLDDRQVVLDVPGDYFGGESAAVIQRHAKRLDAGDDVLVGDDET